MPTNQTFSHEHWDAVVKAFAGCVDTDVLVILHRASNSATFGADLRLLIEQVVRPEVLR